jgi:hypothetical protein
VTTFYTYPEPTPDAVDLGRASTRVTHQSEDGCSIRHAAASDDRRGKLGKVNKNAAMIYWIEAGSGELRSLTMEPHDLHGGTYETEVRLKYALNPVEIATIYLSRAGMIGKRARWNGYALNHTHARARKRPGGVRRPAAAKACDPSAVITIAGRSAPRWPAPSDIEER